jgi:hypothetical protein
MCLTESQAGSDVGSASTKATPTGDGKYKITGTKIYISGGDHDLVPTSSTWCWRAPPTPRPGPRACRCSSCPRSGSTARSNHVAVASIEHKMGIKASATAVLNFGEGGDCLGELVGTEEQRGMSQMFHLMNFARIGVGIQGLAVASSAYLNALDYAKDRKQGSSIKQWKDATAPRVPIIDHPDVRRMLLDMKARVEGIRALAVKLSMHLDRVQRPREDRRRPGPDRLPPRPGRPAGAAGQGLRLRPGVPGVRHRDPGLRRRRLPQGLAGRAVLPRLEDLLDLRGHQPHPGARPGRPQADAARRRQRAGLRQGRRRSSSPPTRTTPRSEASRCWPGGRVAHRHRRRS